MFPSSSSSSIPGPAPPRSAPPPPSGVHVADSLRRPTGPTGFVGPAGGGRSGDPRPGGADPPGRRARDAGHLLPQRPPHRLLCARGAPTRAATAPRRLSHAITPASRQLRAALERHAVHLGSSLLVLSSCPDEINRVVSNAIRRHFRQWCWAGGLAGLPFGAGPVRPCSAESWLRQIVPQPLPLPPGPGQDGQHARRQRRDRGRVAHRGG